MNATYIDAISRTPPPNTPHPDILDLPSHSVITPTGQDYIRWEAQQIRSWLDRQPELQTPATERVFEAERRRYRELWSARNAIVDTNKSTFSTLPAHERAALSARVARAYWMEKILCCRMTQVYRLPPEIVVHVLGFLLDDKPDVYRIPLSAVCRQWREIVVKMPRIWQNVWLMDTAPHTVSVTFMERAQSLPLKVRVGDRMPRRGSPHVEPLTPEEMHSQLDVVLPKIGQIHELTVILRGWPACFAFFERAYACPIAPSILEIFRLHRTSTGYMDLEPIREATGNGRHLRLFGGRATRLRHLIADGVHLDWSIPFSDLDILNLRRMPLAAMPLWSRFTEIAHLSPHLRELTLDGCSPKFSLIDTELPGQRLLLPGLRTLLIGGLSIPFLLRLVYLLDVPRLIELCLKNYDDNANWSPVFQMLTGLHPLLRILHLQAVRVSPHPLTTGAIARFLMSIKDVQVVRLIDMHESFLNLFLEDGRYYLNPATSPVMTAAARSAIEAAHPEPISMLPMLKTVIYDGILTQEIIRFVNSRRTLGLPLERLYAQLPWYLTLSPQDKYALLCIEGFRPLTVAFTMDASPEEQAVWTDIEGPGAVVRHSRV